jgi:hypothetical protein
VSAWPISLIATASDTPPASRSVAAPWRSVWKVIPANPCAAANLRHPVENDAGSHGSPIPLSTTSPYGRCKKHGGTKPIKRRASGGDIGSGRHLVSPVVWGRWR